MNRPSNIQEYGELDLKFGIKSSLDAKTSLALAILMWEAAQRPATLDYSQSVGSEARITIADEVMAALEKYLAPFCAQAQVDVSTLRNTINKNPLLTAQLEALKVAFELIWKLASINFVEPRPNSSERTDGVRYCKKLSYSVNADIIHCMLDSSPELYIPILFSWLGFKIQTNPAAEKRLKQMLAALSEHALFKIKDGERYVVFSQNEVYRQCMETESPVDIKGDGKEITGSLRILTKILKDRMHPYLQSTAEGVQPAPGVNKELAAYQPRVETLLRLSTTKVARIETPRTSAEEGELAARENEETQDSQPVLSGSNVLLYGVPGSGKSWTIKQEYEKRGAEVRRLVFHPDYTHADFAGQLLPVLEENSGMATSEKKVTYKFMPGPFTSILKEAIQNPRTSYVLVIEEINRGNAPAIFGDIFQLLDRAKEPYAEDDEIYQAGTSEYGITNIDIAEYVYRDKWHKVRIPANLSLVGTMNTSDQNVFTLDTAFQRRWHMRLVENSFDNADETARQAIILDTGVLWRDFAETVNKAIITGATSTTSSEDKRLGVYFIREHEMRWPEHLVAMADWNARMEEYRELQRQNALDDNERARMNNMLDAMDKVRLFPEKVIKYLWDDAFKFNREVMFAQEFKSLEQVITRFMQSTGKERFSILNQNIIDELYPQLPN